MQDTIVKNAEINTKIDSKSIFNSFKIVFHYITKIFLNLVLTALILITFTMLVSFIDSKVNQYKGNKVYPLIGAYVIVSPSMVPTIKVQDAILVTRVNPNNLKVGDIITFESSDARYAGYTITHRIKEISTTDDGKRIFITKGDNNSANDSAPVLSENVYGKVILKIPKLGFLQSFLYKPLGFCLLIILPCLAIIIYNIYRIFKRKTNNSHDILNIPTITIDNEVTLKNSDDIETVESLDSCEKVAEDDIEII